MRKTRKHKAKKESNYVMYYKAQNECHEGDDEKASAIIGNLSRDPRLLARNPYYNKTQIPTKHADFLDHDSLYKLGQITLEEQKRLQIRKDSLESSKEEVNVKLTQKQRMKEIIKKVLQKREADKAP